MNKKLKSLLKFFNIFKKIKNSMIYTPKNGTRDYTNSNNYLMKLIFTETILNKNQNQKYF